MLAMWDLFAPEPVGKCIYKLTYSTIHSYTSALILRLYFNVKLSVMVSSGITIHVHVIYMYMYKYSL